MDTTDSATGVPAHRDRTTATTRTMAHQRMVQRWRSGRAETVSPEIISYVHYDGCWWRRTNGMWESIPDGPLAIALSSGHARLVRARAAAGVPVPSRGRDPWTIARNRQRMGVACGKRPAFMPMRATDLRPFPPATCDRRHAA
jgi:hypothetical protein